MDSILASPYLILFARLTLGGVFVLSALTKLLDRQEAAAAFEGRAWLPVPYLALDGLAGGGSTGTLPSAIDAVPVLFLALAAVIVVVLGSSLVATIRGFLRAF